MTCREGRLRSLIHQGSGKGWGRWGCGSTRSWPSAFEQIMVKERPECCCRGWTRGRTHTVTSRDVIFRYPDRVPLTHFVHRAKKVFGMWAWIFCWVFCATGIFRRCTEKHLRTGRTQTSCFQPDTLPLRHWLLDSLKILRIHIKKRKGEEGIRNKEGRGGGGYVTKIRIFDLLLIWCVLALLLLESMHYECCS